MKNMIKKIPIGVQVALGFGLTLMTLGFIFSDWITKNPNITSCLIYAIGGLTAWVWSLSSKPTPEVVTEDLINTRISAMGSNYLSIAADLVKMRNSLDKRCSRHLIDQIDKEIENVCKKYEQALKDAA